MTATCSALAPGVTGLPIDRIVAEAVQPTGNQIQALDDLEIAADRASEVVKASCPSQVPSRRSTGSIQWKEGSMP